MHATAPMKTKGITYPKVITEIDRTHGDKHLRYFKLQLPIALGEGYRQVTSWNAFFNGEREKNYKRDAMGRDLMLYHGREDDPTQYTPTPGVPVIDVLDMWDFYRMIGYDWKKREWYDPDSR